MPDLNSITFSVKAANDAHVLLSEEVATSFQQNRYVEVVLGGWSNEESIIRVLHQDSKIQYPEDKVPTPNILDARSYRDFWISWDQNMVKVGKGLAVGQRMIMKKSNLSNLNIRHIRIWNGYGSGGVWMTNGGIVTLTLGITKHINRVS